MVERYHPTTDSISLIAPHSRGDYVRYSDYAALEAQLAERVRVKPLVWRKPSSATNLKRADTIVGTYRVWTYAEASGEWFWNLLFGSVELADGTGTEEECFAACATDYERRILSALEAAPAPMVTEALKAALTTMYRYQRAGYGDDVFYDDLSQSIRKVEAALTAAQEEGR